MKKKTPMKRLIAVCLALVVVPFTGRVGTQDVSKAATHTTVNSESWLQTIEVPVPTFNEDSTQVQADTTTVKKITMSDLQSGLDLRVNVKGASQELTYGYVEDTEPVRESLATIDAANSQHLGVDAVATELFAESAFTQGKHYAIYAKTAAQTEYQLIYQIQVEKVTVFADDKDGIYSSGVKLGADAYAESVSMQVAGTSAVFTANGTDPVGTIKYAYHAGSELSEEDLKKVDTYTDSSVVSATTVANIGKKVYCYAAYISTYGATTEVPSKVLAYKSLGSVNISNDKTGPSIDAENAVLKEKSGESYQAIANAYLIDNVYYGISDSYAYSVGITDIAAAGQDARGVDPATVTAKIGETTLAVSHSGDTYTFIIPKALADGQKAVTVEAQDFAGNAATPTTLPIKVKYVSQEPGMEVTLANANADGSVVSNQQAELTVRVTSIEAVSKVSFAGQETTSISVSETQTPRVVTSTATFLVPADETVSTTIQNQSAVAYKTDGTQLISKQVGKVIYDVDAPVVNPDSVFIQESTDGVTWTNAGDAKADSEIFVTELDKQYRYVFSASDSGGSGLDSAWLDVNGTKVPCTKEGGLYVAGINGYLSQSALILAKAYVKDVAGNDSAAVDLRKIEMIDTSIRIEKPIITDASGNPVDVQIQKRKTKLNMTVELSSAYKLTELGLYAGGTAVRIDSGDALMNIQDSKTHRYTVKMTVALPAGDVNTYLKDVYLVAKDAANQTARFPETEDKYIGDLLYDITQPTVTVTPEPEDKWYDGYALSYLIKSGDQAVESALVDGSVKYSISRSDKNVQNSEIKVANGQTSVSGKLTVPESKSTDGTLISFDAMDECENKLTKKSFVIKVDETAPTVDLEVNNKVINREPLSGMVSIEVGVADNLSIQSATMTVEGPDETYVKTISTSKERVGVSVEGSYSLNRLVGGEPIDGEYKVTVRVRDKADNAKVQTVTFVYDNTKPTVTAKIQGGTMGGKKPSKNYDGTKRDYYYSSKVPVLLTYDDENIDTIYASDNGNELDLKWKQSDDSEAYETIYNATQDGLHNVVFYAVDKAGNQSVKRQLTFIKDSVAPSITAVVNGATIYTEQMGQLNQTVDTNVVFSVKDANEDPGDFNYQLVKTLPDQLPVTADYIRTSNRNFAYSEEADYQLNVYAKDMAGNKSAIKSVNFRLDKTAPQLQISGTSASNTGATVSFSMTEAFWWDASGTVTITRKAGDAAGEANYKTIDFKPTGSTTQMSETLTETGQYTIHFQAQDRVGHTAQAASYTVVIDKDKPTIQITGAKNNDKAVEAVEFMAQVADDFYLTKKVDVKATRTYLDETYQEKTEDVKFSPFNQAGNPTIIKDSFKEDGIYQISISCSDAAGNSEKQELSFMVDKTKPVIEKEVLDKYQGTLTNFEWDYDLDDVIHDLTVCEVHMYLNGSEYDGTSEIEDGVYTLLVTAEDELGNYQEETVNFTLDTKAPTFIVTGVEDGEVKQEPFDIDVSLQLDEDTLDEVLLDGQALTITGNTANMKVEEKGKHTLSLKAHDDAGNEATLSISFRYGTKAAWWLWVLLGIGGVLVLGGIVLLVRKAKK